MSGPASLQQLLALFQARRFAEMEAMARALLAASPADANAEANNGMVWKALGVALQLQGKDALQALGEAARLLPGDPEAATALGALLSERGQHDQALAAHRRAIALQPGHPEAHCNLGLALSRVGEFDAAQASLLQALRLRPRFPEALLNLGNLLAGLQRDEEAAERLRAALQLRPGWALASQRLLEVLKRIGGEPALAEAVLLKPQDADLIGDLGNALFDAGQPEEALARLREAMALAPAQPRHPANLARALRTLGRIDEAERHCRQAIALDPKDFALQSDLLLLACYQGRALLPLAQEFGRLVQSPATAPARSSSGSGELRIGLVSGDLREHPVGFFAEGVLAALAARGVALFVYANSARRDALGARIEGHCRAWREIHGLADAEAAALIRADGLDVLIDLAGHTAHNRLPLFALRPAPVQISWLGWCGTTGLEAMDFYLGDPWITPASAQAEFSERLLRLPETFLCFRPPPLSLEPGPLPALARGALTFGCFNKLAKLGEPVLALWSRLLHALPQASLLLKNAPMAIESERARLLARFAAHGIAPGRLLLEGASPREAYLAAYQRVDIALDPFPYPGGTTSVEGLWLGVPVLTLSGASALSRQGESLMRNLGLADWVASDAEDWLARAIEHSSDLQALSALRAGLRGRLLASPLCDAPRFAAHMEAALRAAVQAKA